MTAGPEPPPDPRQVARDWITLWQSELSALAADREMQETLQRLLALWAAAGQAMAGGLPADGPPGRSWPAAPAGAAPAAAAPDPGRAEVERLERRIAELERRLAALERGP